MNLEQLLEIALENNFAWITQAKNIEINWVSSALNQVKDGDLLVLDTPEDLHAASSFTAGAVIFPEPQEITAELKRSTIPLLCLKQPIPTRDLVQVLTESLLAGKQSELAKRAAIHEQLAKQITEDKSIQALAQAMQNITGHGILIQDKRLKPIAAFPAPGFNEVWPDIVGSLTLVNCLPNQIQNRKNAAVVQTPLTQKLSGGLSRLILPIIVDEVARGYLSIISLNDSLDEIDSFTAEEGARYCAIEMAHNKAIRETEKKLQSNLLNALLHGILSSRDAELWFQAMGLDEDQLHVPLQFAWDHPNPPSRRRLETIINGVIKLQNLVVILNPTGDKVICFCQVADEKEAASIPLEFAKAVLEQAAAEYPHIPVRCGIGTAAADTNGWSQSFKESGFALDLAFRLKKSSPQYYPELSIYRLLMLLEDQPELAVFQNDLLAPLLAQDNKEILIETLEAFYQNGMNLSQTAEALYIHRNTLSYRLDRISEICSFDFSSADANLAMQIALRVYRLG